jgi:hypothetical protein
LHGVNLHYGLIPLSDVALLFVQYAAIALFVAFAAILLLKDYNKAVIFSFVVLSSFFLFGALKDQLQRIPAIRVMASYSILLPCILLVLVVCFLMLRYRNTSWKLFGGYVRTLLLLFLLYEFLFLSYNVIVRDSDPDFGDRDHSLISNKNIPPASVKPDIFWIVMDEYSASEVLLKKWNFVNPLDSVLKKKKFFVADSATSPYNFTHYSMDAMLDMSYLDGLRSGSVVRFEDMVLGDKSVYQNNVVEFLRRNGYHVKNYTMFDMKDMPAHPYISFKSEPVRLISDNTMFARARKDIGWNFSNMFSKNKQSDDDMSMKAAFQKLAAEREALTRLYEKEIVKGSTNDKPNFFMLQFMLTHEPFLYNADGSIHPRASFTKSDAYISSVEYANKVIDSLCNYIIRTYSSREFVIIFQSDHGFKFDESDPFFMQSNRIPFAVYSSDQNYQGWHQNVSGVNIFRILLNKYFNTALPLLDERTYFLRYRE